MDNLFTFYFVYMVIGIGVGCVCGVVTKSINESKGYDGGFAWGFWLGVIGIIVVACRQPVDYTPRQSIIRPAAPAPAEPVGWKCKCGRYNAPYVSSCVCGRNKSEVALPQVTPMVHSTPAQVVIDPRTIPAAPVDESKNIAALKEYKELLDTGVITQEEFDAKKKSILSR